jgi:hypothetical protein
MCFFTDARKMLAKKLGLYTRSAMKVVDDKTSLLHLRMKTQPGHWQGGL